MKKPIEEKAGTFGRSADKYVSIVDLWPKWGSEELFSFLKLLDYEETEKLIEEHKVQSLSFSLGGLSGALLGKPKTPLEEIEKTYFQNKLSLAMEHSAFKLLSKNGHLQKAFNWIKSRAEYENGSEKTKLKILHSLAFAMCSFVHVLKEPQLPPMTTDSVEKLKAAAATLQSKISDLGARDDHALSSCCDDLNVGLDFLANYEFVKPMRRDETYPERRFLYDLMYWFESNKLPFSPTLAKHLLEVVETPNLGANDRSLAANIHDCRERLNQSRQRLLGWNLQKDARKKV